MSVMKSHVFSMVLMYQNIRPLAEIISKYKYYILWAIKFILSTNMKKLICIHEKM